MLCGVWDFVWLVVCCWICLCERVLFIVVAGWFLDFRIGLELLGLGFGVFTLAVWYGFGFAGVVGCSLMGFAC